jgi:hypothetical protein
LNFEKSTRAKKVSIQVFFFFLLYNANIIRDKGKKKFYDEAKRKRLAAYVLQN